MFIISVTREGTSLNFSLDISRSICTLNEFCRLEQLWYWSIWSIQNWWVLKTVGKQNPRSGPFPVYQDLSMHYDGLVKKAIVDLLIRMKGNLKHTSGNWLNPSGSQEQGFQLCLAGITNQVFITSVASHAHILRHSPHNHSSPTNVLGGMIAWRMPKNICLEAITSVTQTKTYGAM